MSTVSAGSMRQSYSMGANQTRPVIGRVTTKPECADLLAYEHEASSSLTPKFRSVR